MVFYDTSYQLPGCVAIGSFEKTKNFFELIVNKVFTPDDLRIVALLDTQATVKSMASRKRRSVRVMEQEKKGFDPITHYKCV